MNAGDVMEVMRASIWVTILVGGPFMLIALVVGLGISLLQAMTQLQEATLTFVPKVLLLFGAVLVIGPFAINTLIEFTRQLMDRAIGIGMG